MEEVLAAATNNLAYAETQSWGMSSDDDLAGRMRADIVDGKFSPGERLQFATLSELYQSSHGTLREALSQLVSEGFATQQTNKGFSVAPVSRQELLEITEHYIELERRAITGSIASGNESWEANIVAAHHKLQVIEKCAWDERVARHSDWVIRHRDFHASLVAACNDRWLLRLRTLMFGQLDRYRFLTKMVPKMGGGSRALEHKRLMKATLARDASAASTLIDAHIRKTVEKALKLLDT